MNKLPSSITSGIEYRIDHELEYFKKRKALFVDLKDLVKIREYVEDRIQYEKILYNPFTIFTQLDLVEPKLDIPALLNKYSAKVEDYKSFPEGFYATPDGTKRAVLVYAPTGNPGIAGMFQLKNAVLAAIAKVNPSRYSPTIRVEYTGGVQNVIEEYQSLVVDIERSASIVFAAVTLALYFFFRSMIATLCLVFTLFIARFWTFGLSWFLVGFLNANSAFMGTLIFGSGITFGTIFFSRYMEERRRNRNSIHAVKISMEATIRGTLTGALAAGIAYGSLFLTNFEGFKQYGVIGLCGMMFCWFSSVVVLPAVVVQVERLRPFVRKSHKVRPAFIFHPISNFLGLHPGLILIFFSIVTALSLAEMKKFDPETILETDLTRLRSKDSMTKGSGFRSQFLDEIFHRFMTPMVILAPSRPDAELIAEKIRKIQKTTEGHALISSVNTIQQFIPSNQWQKISVLKDIKDSLRPDIFQRLSLNEQKQVKSFLTKEAMRPIIEENLPGLIKEKFTEKDSSIGKLVLVDPPIESKNWSSEKLMTFVRLLRGATNQGQNDSIEVPVVGSFAVVADMISSISRDGPKASLFAFLGIAVMVALLFRRPKIILLMMFSLIMGVIWLLGFLIFSETKINFLNFIVFPITFGIGIDYGVNIFNRYLQDQKKDIVQVVRETGGAVGLCSFTTIISYSSLLLAQNQAMVSFGLLAVLGEVTCLIAAVFMLPAYLLMRKQSAPSHIEVKQEEVRKAA